MKFQRYRGLIRETLNIGAVIALFSAFFVLGPCLMEQSGCLRRVMVELLIIAVIALIAAFSILTDVYVVDGNRLLDMVVIDGLGIKLECGKGQSKSILWEDIAKIDRISGLKCCPETHVTSVRGEILWWYYAGEKQEEYIFEQHPELKQIFTCKEAKL